MKNLTARITRIVSAILLVFGTVFAAVFMNTPNSYVYAVENDEPGNNVQLDDEPGNNNQNTNPGNNIEIDNLNPDNNGNNVNIDNTPSDPSNPGNNVEIDDSDSPTDPDNPENPGTEDQPNTCEDQVGALAWIVCPTTGVIAKFIDAIYNVVDGLSVVPPLSMEADSPIYLVWQYARNITNIVFVIFLLIVIYSQLTGFGINNYGVKRILPRLIIAVVLVNLSFVICSLAVDLSNIIGSTLREFFTGIQQSVIANGQASEIANVPLGEIITSIISGVGIAGIAIDATGGGAALFWMLLPVLLGAVIAIVSGLLTIAARQALVALLIMVSPLAFVAYLLPNTEKWFQKWKQLLFQMLIFYPMFSFLFGASQLAGWALITSAHDGFGLILGIAVQIFPLVFSWALMKMSGTILGTLNAGLRRLAAPAERGIAGWSLSHKELNRQRYLANSMMPGAKLRRYLDYRRELRELDTKNSLEIRHGKAHERALITASSSTGVDKDGNDTWSKRANRYTKNAKTAALYETRVGVANAAYRNTLSAYGRHFSGSGANRLSDAHGEAYLNTMKQQFLTANEAQADQEWLLSQYMDATTNHDTNPYQFNRLIKGAAGSLGHTGEASIMGQVIVGNAQIESRRRSEARIIINKFGIKKPQFRAMVYDKAGMTDDGFATNKDGKVVENIQHRLLPGEHYDEWQDYIWVDKDSGKELTRAEYDALSANEKASYKRIRYFDITDDNNKLIQRVYEDDAGYMKELLTDDINIGDPINRRYLTQIGVKHAPEEQTGILRRYHSTITAAMLASKYKEHAAEVTPMITAQTNMGYVTSIGQYNIANLQSLSVASKAGPFLQNDGYAIDTWRMLLSSVDDQLFEQNFKKIYDEQLFDNNGNRVSAFEFFFPDSDVMNYRNVNGQALKGFRLSQDENGSPVWQEVSASEATLEDRKNYIKHNILPKAAVKLAGMMNRSMSPGVLENQKPDTLEALKKLIDTLTDVGTKNMDPSTSFEDILGAGTKNQDFFAGDDPRILQDKYRAAKSQVQNLQGNPSTSAQPSNSNIPGGSGGRSYPPRPQSGRQGVDSTYDSLMRSIEAQQDYAERNNIQNITTNINIYCQYASSLEQAADALTGYFETVETLNDDYILGELQDIIYYLSEKERQLGSTEDGISQIADYYQRQRELIDDLQQAAIDLVYRSAH